MRYGAAHCACWPQRMPGMPCSRPLIRRGQSDKPFSNAVFHPPPHSSAAMPASIMPSLQPSPLPLHPPPHPTETFFTAVTCPWHTGYNIPPVLTHTCSSCVMCQLMASPSLSGSVASSTLPQPDAADAISRRRSSPTGATAKGSGRLGRMPCSCCSDLRVAWV